jgi:hypothetical protein
LRYVFIFCVCHKMFVVWFHLVNEEGHPHQGSTPTSLSISEGTNVDNFRKEVKKDYFPNESMLFASQLKVYKTVAALLGEEEAPPLKASTFIDSSFGPSEDNPLAVVVPAAEEGGFPSFPVIS